MTTSAMTDLDLQAAITARRAALAQVLEGLPLSSWDADTLCDGWRVREVVAHMTMPLRYSSARFAVEMIRSGGRFNQMADRCARRDAGASSEELAAAMRDNAANPWKPPGGGFEGALVHDVVHALDITVPLEIHLPVPDDAMRAVLDGLTKARSLQHFGVDLTGTHLQAEDLDWAFGSPTAGSGFGDVVSATAQELALALCARPRPAGGVTLTASR